MEDQLQEAVRHLKNMLGFTFDPKNHRRDHMPDLDDNYHRLKQAAADFVLKWEKTNG